MKPDFDGAVVLANTARVLRSRILPTISDEQTRSTVIGLVAVIETHLAQIAVTDPEDGDENPSLASFMNLDGGLLLAFGGRLPPEDEDRRDHPT